MLYESPSMSGIPCVTIFIGVNADGKPVFLRDIWPTRDEIQAVESKCVIPGMFKEVYEKIEVLDYIYYVLFRPYPA